MKIDEIVLEAAPKRVKVVRRGKVVRKLRCQPGSKLVGRRCVRQTSKERIIKSRAARKGARKGKVKRIRTRARSIKVRRARRL